MHISIGWSFLFLEVIRRPFAMSRHMETVCLALQIGVPLVKLVVAQVYWDYFHMSLAIRRPGLATQES